MKTLLLICTLILVLLIKTQNTKEVNRDLIISSIYNVLCQDGELAELGASILISNFNEYPVSIINLIKESNDHSNELTTKCNKEVIDSYLDPKFYNAILTVFMSEYGTDHIPESIKNQLIKFNRTNTDPDLDYFIKQLIKI